MSQLAEDVQKIADTYHSWRKGKAYSDVAGFCKSAKLEEIRKHGHILTPGRYVGSEEVEEDGEAFDEKMKRLTSELAKQKEEGKKLDQQIKVNLENIGFKVL